MTLFTCLLYTQLIIDRFTCVDLGRSSKMLTLDAILKTTEQMSSYGEGSVRGAMDHVPDRVQGQPKAKGPEGRRSLQKGTQAASRRWDDDLKVYVCK